MITYHMIAFIIGCVLDFFIGDPYQMPHPIRLIGRFIGLLEKKWNTVTGAKARARGRCMVVLVSGTTLAVTAVLLLFLYRLHSAAGIAAEAVLTCYVLAARSLQRESTKVQRALEAAAAGCGDLDQARYAVSMIVGRDTKALDATGVAKAAIETVAENTSDGVIAPMLYTAVGGPALGLFYKSINTMDSMVGYKNERYLDFGRAAALLDDVVNFIPSRISAALMIAACLFLGPSYSAGNARRIHKRDSRKHASPNSAQTESVCAGALGLQLAGDASYFGVLHKKPYIGDPTRPVETADIGRANRLMYMTAALCMLLCVGGMAAAMIIKGVFF